LDGPNLFWSSLDYFGHVQKNLIWTRPKQFEYDQNNLYSAKTIWTIQNLFGLVKQGIQFLHFHFLFSGRQILIQIVFLGTFCSFHKTLSRFTFPKQQNGIGYGTYYSCDYILSHVFSLVFVAFAILALLFLCIWSIIFTKPKIKVPHICYSFSWKWI